MFNMGKRFILCLPPFTSFHHPHLWFPNMLSPTVQPNSLYVLYIGSSDISSILEMIAKLQLYLIFGCYVFCFGVFFADISSNLRGLVSWNMAKLPPGTTQVWKHLGHFLSTWAHKLSQVKLLVMLSFNTSTLYSQYWLCLRKSKGSSEHSLLRAGLQDQADSTSRPWVMSGPLHHTLYLGSWGLTSPSLAQMPRLPPPTQPSVLEDPLQTYEANHKIIWLWNAKWHLSCATYIFLPSVLSRFPICVPRICPFPALPVLSSRHHPLQGKPAALCSPPCRTLPHNLPFPVPCSQASQRDNMQIHSSLSLSTRFD